MLFILQPLAFINLFNGSCKCPCCFKVFESRIQVIRHVYNSKTKNIPDSCRNKLINGSFKPIPSCALKALEASDRSRIKAARKAGKSYPSVAVEARIIALSVSPSGPPSKKQRHIVDKLAHGILECYKPCTVPKRRICSKRPPPPCYADLHRFTNTCKRLKQSHAPTAHITESDTSKRRRIAG